MRDITMEQQLSSKQSIEASYHDRKYKDCQLVMTRKRQEQAYNFFSRLRGDVRNLRILDYGCGVGWLSIDLVKEGAAEVYGIDISQELVEKARDLAEAKGVLEKIHFAKMPAENLTFADNSFDLILGSAILHHTELKQAVKNIFRVLKPGGRALFIEPMNENIFLKVWRVATPWRRSSAERALVNKDLQLIKNFFPAGNYQFFKLFSILTTGLTIPFPNNKLLSSLDRFLEKIDTKLLSIFPSIGKYCAVVVLELLKK